MSQSDHIAAVKSGIHAWRKWRRECQLGTIDLSGADLADLDLTGFDLSGANLSQTQFRRVRFEGANLNSSNLSDALISECVLSSSSFCNSSLSEAALVKAKVAYCDFRNARGMRCTLKGVQIIEANFSNATFIESDFSGAHFTAVSFSGARFEGCNFTRSVLKCAIFTGVSLTNSNFTETDLESANFQRSNLTMARFLRTKLLAAEFDGAILCDAQIQELESLPKSPSLLFLEKSGTHAVKGHEAEAFFKPAETVRIVFSTPISHEALGAYHVFVGECEAKSIWPKEIAFLGATREDTCTIMAFQAPDADLVVRSLGVILGPFRNLSAVDWIRSFESLPQQRAKELAESLLKIPAFESVIAERLRRSREFTEPRILEIRLRSGTIPMASKASEFLALPEGASLVINVNSYVQKPMGDIYNIQQAAAVGPGAHGSVNHQQFEGNRGFAELPQLSIELRQILTLINHGDSGISDADIAALREASEAAEQKDTTRLRASLANVSKGFLSFAEKVGANLVAAVLKDACGLGL